MNTINERDEINRRISGWLEPKPADRPSWSHQESEGKAWTSSFKGVWVHKTYPPNQEGYPEPEYGWKPLDYFTDESANAMLLEAMPEPTLRVDRYTGSWMCNASPSFSMVEDRDRKTAVVLAFLKFAKLDAPSGGEERG